MLRFDELVIRHQKGRWKSERTDQEAEDLLTTEIRHLTPAQRRALDALIAEQARGEEQLKKYGMEVIYHTKPVSMAQWLDDPYHMNGSTKTLYPKIREDLIDVFETPSVREVVLVGSIGFGKTTFASVAMCRLLYELSCMRSPQEAFGLSAGSEMVISPISKSLHLARTVLKSAIDDKLKISPYFREKFTPKIGGDITKFPSNLMLSIGSFQSARTLGQNIFGGCLTGRHLVTTEHGDMPIVQMKGKKIRVWTRTDGGKLYLSDPVETILTGQKKILLVRLCSEQVLECTPDHRWDVIREDGTAWVRAEDIVCGDVLATYEGRVAVAEVRHVDWEEPVYDIVLVQGTHRFFTGLNPDIPFVASHNCLDEANFGATKGQQIMATGHGGKTIAQYDIAEKIYAGIIRRIKSRFLRAGGNLPGLMVLLSSANTVGSFTDRKIAQSINDPSVFTRDYSAWDVKPPEHYSGKKFKIVVGTSALRSRIVPEDEEIDDDWLDREGAIVLDVPIEYYDDFDRDLEGSIRDIAGLSTHAISAYINRLEKLDQRIVEHLQHPFTVEEYTYGLPGKFKWDLLSKSAKRRLPGGFEEVFWRPIRNPHALRYIHIDTSISGDCTGLCMGYVDRMVEVIRRDEEMNEYNDIAPYVVIELLLRIAPPPGEQIYLADVRRLVYELMAHGFNLCGFSTDSFQSADTIQQVKRHGVRAEILSVDRTTAPYDSLKSAIYEDRIEYYRYKPLLDELKALEWDRLKGKVDHPLSGCFIGETMVALADGTSVPIASLEGKEVQVFACDRTGAVVCAKAIGRKTKDVTALIEVQLGNGQRLRCTPEHRWMLASGHYLEASKLTPRFTLLKSFSPAWTATGLIPMGERREIKEIREVKITKAVAVYDLEVDECHNFALTAGVFVHNSKDVSDAAAGVVFGLTEAVKRLPISMPLKEEKPKPLEEMAWMGGDILIPVGPDFDSERFREEYGPDDDEDASITPGLIPIIG